MLSPKIVLPVVLACVIAAPLAIKSGVFPFSSSALTPAESSAVGTEPSAGGDVPESSVPGAPEATTAQITNATIIPPISEKDLEGAEGVTIAASVIGEAAEDLPLKITPDKPEIVHLTRDVVNVIVGSEEHLRVVPDTNRTLIIIPKKPGATFFKALDNDGNVIMQRHVIIAAPQKKYIRIRRACADGDASCKGFSVYYCPDMCHEVSVVQDASTTESPIAPSEASSSGAQASDTPTEPMQ
jgi:hypothetical protein